MSDATTLQMRRRHSGKIAGGLVGNGWRWRTSQLIAVPFVMITQIAYSG